jgi:protocatechuate 3,4-dioxygenase beta subunit
MNATILLLCAVLRIASAAEPGQRLVLTGHVFGPDGKARPGVALEVWHTDAGGHYRLDHGDGPARLRGVVRTDAGGAYAIETIKPGLYPGATHGAHIHVKIDGGPTQTLFIDGGQPLLRLTRDAHGVLHATYDFHLGGGAR